jgi:NADPH:quinone reductase-like Zn-dependent oxidoreductase
VTSALQCIPLPDDVSFELGSMHCVNPMTAIGLISTAKNYGAKAVIISAAASQLGRMINRYAQGKKITCINLVRKEEQVKILQDLDCTYIINTSEEDWEKQLYDLSRKLKATVCFEAVAGELTGKILNNMP